MRFESQVVDVPARGLILSAPDLLLLDEPTNHLDMAATEWLENFLARGSEPFVLVSHDRTLLDRVCTSIAEIENGGLEQHAVDVVVTSLDLLPGGSSAVLAAMRERPEWRRIPVLALADRAEQIRERVVQPTDFQDCQLKLDRDAMLESVARLATALDSAETVPVCAGEER